MSLSRRRWLQAAGLGLLGSSLSGHLPGLAARAAASGRRCVLLWMTGGPSQIDTFDLKPGHANGGEFKEIATRVPGLRFSEHLPRLAEQADQLAVLRSLVTKEGDHGRGTFLVRTGHAPTGPIRYPAIGSLLAKELGDEAGAVPSYVSVSPYRVFNQAAHGPGFLGPKHAALTVGAADVFQPTPPTTGYQSPRVDNLRPPAAVGAARHEARLATWRDLQADFLAEHRGAAAVAHDTVYERAARLIHSAAAKAFDLEQEPAATRDAYGPGQFGQGCLMARRLLEAGVPVVEVALGAFGGAQLGWDTHRDNFAAVKRLSAELDAGWSSLMRDLADRGLLETTTILWTGEFGRTPVINRAGGRDHHPNAWTSVLAGGGVAGGQAYGRTSADGATVEEDPLSVGDVLATLCAALGVPPDRQNMSEQGRPIRVAEGRVVSSVLRGPG